jgi:hypothetical protein
MAWSKGMGKLKKQGNAVNAHYLPKKEKAMKSHKAFGGIYGLAFIGAAIYFIQHSTSFWTGVIGFLKALVWPAVLMYKLLEFLKM